MRFTEAVKNCAYYKYARFKGRSSRSEFWWFFLAYFACNALLIVFAALVPSLGSAAIGGFALVSICPYAAALVRRLHDVGLSGRWVAAVFLLSLATSALAVYEQYAWLRWISTAAFLILFVAAMLPGSRQSNAYGPRPLS